MMWTPEEARILMLALARNERIRKELDYQPCTPLGKSAKERQ